MFSPREDNLDYARKLFSAPFSASSRTPRKKAFVFLFAVLTVIFVGYFFFLRAPAGFPTGTIFTVSRGASLSLVSRELKAQSIIRSPVAFQFFVILYGRDRALLPGDYLLDKKISGYGIAKRIAHGQYHIAQIKVTLPEGLTTKEMSAVLAGKIPGFDPKVFATLTKGREGYLFPNTYFFFPKVTTEEIALMLENTFTDRIKPLLPDIAKSGWTEKEIITMASIVEKEAAGSDDRATIAGILWKRIGQGIPLQVDATFIAINGKESSELTKNDLLIDSPYNTYKYKGLPPGPICNPGTLAVEAVLHPTESPYFFYLHDSHGMIHYAKTFEEHKANKLKYL